MKIEQDELTPILNWMMGIWYTGVVVFWILLFFTGCTATKPVVLQTPSTGEIRGQIGVTRQHIQTGATGVSQAQNTAGRVESDLDRIDAKDALTKRWHKLHGQ